MPAGRAGAKRLIVNADDFGQTADVTETTIQLFERGALTSATILLNMPATDRAVRYAKENAGRFSFGLHFNFVDQGVPVARPAPRSLVDRGGLFFESNVQRRRVLSLQARPDDVAREFDAQLSYLREHGVRVSHVDSHGHMHKLPPVIHALRPVMRRHGVLRVRRTQDLFAGPLSLRRALRRVSNELLQAAFPELVHSEHFLMLHEHTQRDWLTPWLRRLPEGTTEIGIHPGREEVWRAVEMAPFQAAPLAELLQPHGIVPITYDAL